MVICHGESRQYVFVCESHFLCKRVENAESFSMSGSGGWGGVDGAGLWGLERFISEAC